MRISIREIRTDGGTQIRAGIDVATVGEYAEAYKAGAKMPPIVVFYDGKVYWLADGFHRVQARKLDQETEIEADLRPGTRRDAILFAAGANESHGRRRTNEDKRRAVETLLRDEEWAAWSDRKIAEVCRVHHQLVGRMRGELSGGSSRCADADAPEPRKRKVQRGGKTYEQDTAKIGKGRRRESVPSDARDVVEVAPSNVLPLKRVQPSTDWDASLFLSEIEEQTREWGSEWLRHEPHVRRFVGRLRAQLDLMEKVDAKKSQGQR